MLIQRRARRVAFAAGTLLLAAACSDGATPPPAAPPAMGIAAPSAAIALPPGRTGTARIGVSRSGGFAGRVTLAVSDLPPGITATLAPATLEGDATESVVTTAVSAGVAPGSYAFTVSGSASGVAPVRTTVPVTVAAEPAPAISLGTPAAAGVTVVRGASVSVSVAVARTNGFAGEVTLAAEGLPTGVTATFAPATVPAGEGASTLTLGAVPDAAAGGPTTVTVRARGAGVSDATVTVPLTVTVPPAALTVAAPAALSVAQGAAGTAAITFTRANFSGDVTVSLESAPAGVSAASVVVPASASSASLGVSVVASAATGAHALTVRLAGPGGQPSATATLPLTVVAKPVAAAALDGVYMSLVQNLITDHIYEDYWTFFPDGRMMRIHPSEGLARPTDYAAACDRVQCGTYAVSGTELRIRWGADATEKVYDFDAAGSFAERGRVNRYRMVAPMTGRRLEGRYAVPNSFDPADPYVRIEFTAEGRFTESQLLPYTDWAQLAPPGETRVPLTGGAGRYAIARNTLELRYDGGLTAYFFFTVPLADAASPSPSSVSIARVDIRRVP